MKLPFCIPIFIVLIVSVSCGTQKQQTEVEELPIAAEHITFKNIRSINLSEDMSSLSTNEDELLIKIDIINDSYRIINKLHRQTYLFKETEQVLFLNKGLTIDTNMSSVIISFIELDNYNSSKRVLHISDSLIQKGVFQNTYAIDSLFRHDDYLGVIKIDLDTPFTSSNNFETIKGMQLFDRYEYRVEYSVK